ncbi:hypothetical protein KAFR_0F03080 [Kazachstania africana CBS 2517]|uniref:tRNA wybutosine-synthesizing protein 3 n=1 Tax=Kazachstania africana (strain ATCC 22294 / BCRC 22015 / CBS 2517 / CECT 1963 / NBRC 1671 / NRRL Y-8276) TaxID=1071382 RepID=H2AX04_KAZAF|nr:hypothetical protein KAFR_0F03080 [Kazachstania africana CBS 2517]CCF58904.1 hypothetical protein KAFR_0F03080 [Kazachstania africana CBS 2517]
MSQVSAQNSFNQKKASILKEISSTASDLSPKGSIDELCLPVMDLINSHNDMVTTSSCSGRISVFVEGTKRKTNETDLKVGGKGQGGKWLYVSHDINKVIGWMDTLNDVTFVEDKRSSPLPSDLDGSLRYILYKYEPFILHVKCRDFETASHLYNVAMSCGFRESGIGSNNLVAIRINIKLDVPIGYLNEENDALSFFVTKEYINLLDQLTLSKFNDNTKKMAELYRKVENEMINVTEAATMDNSSKVGKVKQETKDERRERKRREGLERQRQVQQRKEEQEISQ